MNESSAKFAIGQLITHRLFNYRGVVFDVDPFFLGDDQWYEDNARSHPPKDEPWYRVLVDGQLVETYVAERNLKLDVSSAPIHHALTDELFADFQNGRYQIRAEERH